MDQFSVGELFLIYGFLSLFLAIGILFILQAWFFRKGFYKKYTLHTTAVVKEYVGSRLKDPVYLYETILDGETVILVEQSSIGAPFYLPNVGDVVDVYIHPDPNKTVTLSIPPDTKTRVFGCEKRFHSISKFYLGFGLGFAGAAILGIAMFTVSLLN